MAGIVIVGDWVVDEYWMLAAHHSDISSHVGMAHHRIVNAPEDVFMDLCGAGHVARVLLGIDTDGARHTLWGLGRWNRRPGTV